MATKKYDLSIKASEYTNAQGEKKGNYVRVGSLMTHSDGREYIMLEKWFDPQRFDHSDKTAVILSCFAPQQRNQGQQAQAPQNLTPQSDTADDMPF